MKPSFYVSRMPVAASEPNFSGAGPTGRLPSQKAIRIVGLAGTLCLAVPLGLAFYRDTPALVIALVAAGAALVLAACLFADCE
jgi:hypothetical protein